MVFLGCPSGCWLQVVQRQAMQQAGRTNGLVVCSIRCNLDGTHLHVARASHCGLCGL